MKILVTAFEPFGGSSRNSSLDILESLSCTTENCKVVMLKSQ